MRVSAARLSKNNLTRLEENRATENFRNVHRSIIIGEKDLRFARRIEPVDILGGFLVANALGEGIEPRRRVVKVLDVDPAPVLKPYALDDEHKAFAAQPCVDARALATHTIGKLEKRNETRNE